MYSVSAFEPLDVAPESDSEGEEETEPALSWLCTTVF